jgi:hypothetical protein
VTTLRRGETRCGIVTDLASLRATITTAAVAQTPGQTSRRTHPFDGDSFTRRGLASTTLAGSAAVAGPDAPREMEYGPACG